MGYKINLAKLAGNFINATELPPHKVNDSYLVTEVFKRILADEIVYVGDVDFSQFTADDLDEFREYLEDNEQEMTDINSFCKHYQKATPTAEVCRAFC